MQNFILCNEEVLAGQSWPRSSISLLEHISQAARQRVPGPRADASGPGDLVRLSLLPEYV